MQFLIDSSEQVIDAWYKVARKSVQIPLPDTELRTWLRRYLFAFIDQINNQSGSPTDKALADFADSLRKSGASYTDTLEILFLFSHVLESIKVPSSQGDPENGDEIISNLKNQVIHVMTDNTKTIIAKAAEENSRQYERTATLLRVAKAASSSLDLEKVIHTISEEIVQALDARACNSFLFPEHSRYGNYFLLDLNPPAEYSVPDPPEPFGLEALRLGEPVICYDAALDPRTDKETVRFFGLKSLMAFPLISNGKPIAAGLIVMNDYHHFTQEEIDLVMGIANATAVAIENAQLFEKTKHLAIIEERNRLSVEMHDNLAQALAIIKLDINSLLTEDMQEAQRIKLQEMKTLVNETYIDLRDTIFGLRAINESDTHFLDNFKNYLRTFSVHTGLAIQISVTEEDLNRFSQEAVLQVGRILGESLSNIRKHANAEHVWINSGIEDKAMWITVEDDGIGIDFEKVCGCNEGHFGIRVMAERAESVGGKLSISNRAEGGTCVKLEIPLG